ncbi:MAG: DEAD/DEAH box helicase [Candidatus Aenigmarchaeota archaeon]|nr:DEAD/DEAH box helicase [Candidatus Aenigmarchaeota archaeon]
MKEKKYFAHHLIVPGTIEEREYQKNILETCKRKNTLVVLPTGMGKTPISVMLAAERLDEFPDSKILIMAPTKPLCAQHEKSFRKFFDISKKEIMLVTGKIPPQNRKEYYNFGKIICATPQTIANDVEKKVVNLEKFSLLIVDEVHRAVKKYSYPYVCRKYMQQAANPRILGLTASPGSSEEKIQDICKNLFVEAVEIRGEKDGDVKQYMHEMELEQVKVELTDEMKRIQSSLKFALRERLEKLKSYRVHVYTKSDLIIAQKRVQRMLSANRNPIYFHQISLIAETVKVWHALELLETQSLKALKLYFDRLKAKTDKSSERMLNDLRIVNAKRTVELMLEGKKEHPKILKLREIITEELKKNKNIKIIVFSHFRDNIERVYEYLKGIENCKPVILIGQAGERGLKQKEQIDIIKDYEAYIYNVLITSPIGEEGLNLVGSDIAIFYEPVSSEIRTLQRRGRVGRFKAGKVIFLITKGTRDETNFYISRRKEKNMKEILRGMQENGMKRQKGLGEF